MKRGVTGVLQSFTYTCFLLRHIRIHMALLQLGNSDSPTRGAANGVCLKLGVRSLANARVELDSFKRDKQ